MNRKWVAGVEFDTREEAEEWARSGRADYVLIEPWTDGQRAALRTAISFLSDGAWNDDHYAAMRALSPIEDRLESA